MYQYPARLSSGVKCSRAMLIVLNIIFLFLGLTVLGLGIYTKVDGNFSIIAGAYSITQALGNETMQWIGTIMIIAGTLTSCLAAFGCLGAIHKNRVFLYSYAIILTLIIILEFAAVIVVLKYRNDLWFTYDSGYKDVFDKAYQKNQTEMINLIEKIEREFKCCGVNGPTDYVRIHRLTPRSCYPGEIITAFPFTDGCAKAVAQWVWNELPVIAAVVGIVLFIEIFGVIAALILGVAISHSEQAENYDRF